MTANEAKALSDKTTDLRLEVVFAEIKTAATIGCTRLKFSSFNLNTFDIDRLHSLGYELTYLGKRCYGIDWSKNGLMG